MVLEICYSCKYKTITRIDKGRSSKYSFVGGKARFKYSCTHPAAPAENTRTSDRRPMWCPLNNEKE